MSFLNPEFLYYMLVPLFILFGFLITKKESQEHFFSEEIMQKLRVRSNALTLRTRNILFLFVSFFMIIALAQPVIDDGLVVVKAKSSDIMIALDISDSMLAQDVYPNRLGLAKQKAITLLSEAPNERIGVLAFAKSSYLVSPFSFDTTAVSFLLTQLDTKSITEQGTDYLSVLEVFSKSQENKSVKNLLILTDGGDSHDFSKEIKFAKDNNIVVFVLAVGTKQGAPVKLNDGTFIKENEKILVSKLNENISDLATKTGGVYIKNTTSSSDIKTMLKEIKAISKAKELKSEEIHKYIPLFYYPVGISILLLLIAISSIGKIKSSNIAVLFFLFSFMFVPMDSKAGILDFMKIKDAKAAYEKGDYEKSTNFYKEYAKKSNDPKSFFNAGNSLYKQEKYKEAVDSYDKAIFEDDNLKAKNYFNKGNALAKMQKYEDAIKSYEESLKIKEDKFTKENLQKIKKFLEKQKQKQKNKSENNSKDKEQQNKDSKNNKDNKNSENKGSKNKKEDKNSENKSNNTDKKDNKPNDKDKVDKSKDDEKNENDQKGQNQQDKSTKEQMPPENKNEEAQKDNSKSQIPKKEVKDLTSKDQSDDQKKKTQKDQLKKLDQNNKNENLNSLNKEKGVSKIKMSDAEENKWLNELNSQKNTYLYQLSEEKPMKEKSNEKPW